MSKLGEFSKRLLLSLVQIVRGTPTIAFEAPKLPLVFIRMLSIVAVDAIALVFSIREVFHSIAHNVKAVFFLTAMEVRFISRQGLTSYLILAYPVIVMLIVGPSLTIFELGNVNVALLENETWISGLINGSDRATAVFVSDVSGIQQAIREGRARVGLVSMVNGDRREIDVYQDPLKIAASADVTVFLERQISDDLANTVGRRVLDIYNQMNGTLTELEERRDKIGEVRGKTGEHKARLAGIKSKRAGFNESEFESVLSQVEQKRGSAFYRTMVFDQQVSSINETLRDLDAISLDVQDSREKVEALKDRFQVLQEVSKQVKNSVDTTLASLDETDAILNDSIYSIQQAVPQISDPSLQAQLSDTASQLLIARAGLQVFKSGLEANKRSLDIVGAAPSAEEQINLALSKVEGLEARVKSAHAQANSSVGILGRELSSIETELNETRILIADLDARLEKGKSLLNATDDLVNSFDADLAKLEGELDSSERVLNSTISQVKAFLAEKPSDIRPPDIVKKNVYEGLRQVEIIFPILICLDAMLTCMLLPVMMTVRQRNQGAEMRLRLTGVSSVSLILGRFLGNFLVGTLVLFVLVLAGKALINLNTGPVPIWFAFALAAVPACFTALGVLFSTFIRRESTAILVTLLVSLPMIFISEAIIPIEFITQPVRSIGEATPLWFSIKILASTMISGLGWEHISTFAAALGTFVFLFLLSALIIHRHLRD